MKKAFGIISVTILLTLLLSAGLTVGAEDPPPPDVDWIDPPVLPCTILDLDVGESVTFAIDVASAETFLFAMAKMDHYYPGRGIHAPAGDRVEKGTSGSMEITVTGKNSTADMLLVDDWYGCKYLAGGVAPTAIVAGMRYDRGIVVAEYYPFAVRVEP